MATVDVLLAGYPNAYHPMFDSRLKSLDSSYVTDYHYAMGISSRLPVMAQEIAWRANPPDVIVVADTPSASAARDATIVDDIGDRIAAPARIPVIIVVVSNPLYPPRLNDPHLIGVADHTANVDREDRVCVMVSLLEANGRSADKIAVLYNGDNPGKAREVANIRALIGGGGTTVERYAAHESSHWDFAGLIAAIQADGIDGVIVGEDPIVFAHRDIISREIRTRGLIDLWESVEAMSGAGGGVPGFFCYGPDRVSAWLWAADKAHEVISTHLHPPFHDQWFELPFRFFIDGSAAGASGVNVPVNVCNKQVENVRERNLQRRDVPQPVQRNFEDPTEEHEAGRGEQGGGPGEHGAGPGNH